MLLTPEHNNLLSTYYVLGPELNILHVSHLMVEKNRNSLCRLTTMCQEDLLICILEVRESVTYPQSQLVHSPVRHEIKYISSLCSFH